VVVEKVRREREVERERSLEVDFEIVNIFCNREKVSLDFSKEGDFEVRTGREKEECYIPEGGLNRQTRIANERGG
jgi:hypothetical protein